MRSMQFIVLFAIIAGIEATSLLPNLLPFNLTTTSGSVVFTVNPSFLVKAITGRSLDDSSISKIVDGATAIGRTLPVPAGFNLIKWQSTGLFVTLGAVLSLATTIWAVIAENLKFRKGIESRPSTKYQQAPAYMPPMPYSPAAMPAMPSHENNVPSPLQLLFKKFKKYHVRPNSTPSPPMSYYAPPAPAPAPAPPAYSPPAYSPPAPAPAPSAYYPPAPAPAPPMYPSAPAAFAPGPVPAPPAAPSPGDAPGSIWG